MEPVTDLPRTVLQFPENRRKADCQGERLPNILLASQMEAAAQALGIDLSVQTKERRERLHKEAWDDFAAACRHLFHVAIKDPSEHAIKLIQDMRGPRHD